jgi:hypothetical protein
MVIFCGIWEAGGLIRGTENVIVWPGIVSEKRPA